MKNSLKYLILILLLVNNFGYAQQIPILDEVDKKSVIPKGFTNLQGKAVFYGKFIQRLGFSSGGFPQDIRLLNLDTKEIVAFRVKPAFKSAKENNFCYLIDAGNYAIINYWWTKSGPLVNVSHTEPIFKGIDATDKFNKKLKAGEIKQEDLQMFIFSLEANSLNYLGTWHFDKGVVSFSDDKNKQDSEMKEKYKKIDFSDAKTTLPK